MNSAVSNAFDVFLIHDRDGSSITGIFLSSMNFDHGTEKYVVRSFEERQPPFHFDQEYLLNQHAPLQFFSHEINDFARSTPSI